MDYKKAKIEEIQNLTPKDVKRLSKEDQTLVLEKLVKHHNELYFLQNTTVISDPDFDELVEMLKKLKPSSKFLYEIVGDIGNVEHPYPLLSIDKKYSHEDVVKWLNDTADEIYRVEPKYDGMRAIYDKKNRIMATRGNGKVGEDISERFKHLNIIGNLEKTGDFAEGEIVIPNDYFDKNLAQTYKNSRNAAVGIIKAKQITEEGIKALQDGGIHLVLYDQKLSKIYTKGQLEEKESWESILEEVFYTNYPIDGLVIKATNENIKQNLGATAHHERWQIAYKVPGERKWSKVVGITDQVGRTGRITSVAHIEPIKLSGAKVQNITLHNFDYITKSGIGIGSKVEVIRSGEVIPYITHVDPSKTPHKAPETCPVCAGKVAESGKYLECTNVVCPAKVSQSIEHYFKSLGVEELGAKTIEKFIKEFKLKGITDFYHLNQEKIAELEGFGEKSAIKITNNVKNTLEETVTPSQLLRALGIKEVGGSVANWIINEFGFENLNKITEQDLQNIKGVGPNIAASFIKEIDEKWKIVEHLKKLGLKFKQEKTTEKLNGLSFCITGKKEQYSRDELIKMVEANGGEYKSSVTKDLNYLVAGEDAGSKLQKATDLSVKIITEQELLDLIH